MSLLGFNTTIIADVNIGIDGGTTLSDGITVVSTKELSLLSDISSVIEESFFISTNDNSTLHPITYNLVSDDILIDIISVDTNYTIINVTYSPLVTELGESILTLNFDNNGVNIPFNVTLNYKSTIPSSDFIFSISSIDFGEIDTLVSAEQFITITCNNAAFDLTYLDTIVSSTGLDSLGVILTFDSRIGNEIKYKVTFKPLYTPTTTVSLQFTYNNIKVGDVVTITGSKVAIPLLPTIPELGSIAPLEPIDMLIPYKNTSGSRYRITGAIINNDTLGEFTISNLDILVDTIMSSGEVIYVAVIYTPKKETTSYPNITLTGIAFNDALQPIEYTPLPQIIFVKPDSNDPLVPTPPNIPYTPVIIIEGNSDGGTLPSGYSITTTTPYTQSGSDIKDFVFNTPATFTGANVFYRLNFVADLQYTPTVTFSSNIHTGDNITITFGNFESDTTVTNSHANVNSTLTNTWPLSTPIITTSLFSQIDGIKTAQFIFHPSEKVVNVNYEVIPLEGGLDNTLPNVTFSKYSASVGDSIIVTFSNFGTDTSVTAVDMQTPIGLSGTAYYLTTSFFNKNVGAVTIPFTFHPSEKVVNVNYTVLDIVLPLVTFSDYSTPQNGGTNITFSNYGTDTSVIINKNIAPNLQDNYTLSAGNTLTNFKFLNHFVGTKDVPFQFLPSGTIFNVNYTVEAGEYVLSKSPDTTFTKGIQFRVYCSLDTEVLYWYYVPYTVTSTSNLTAAQLGISSLTDVFKLQKTGGSTTVGVVTFGIQDNVVLSNNEVITVTLCNGTSISYYYNSTPTYSITSDITDTTQPQTVTFTITTTNVPNNTDLDWYISPHGMTFDSNVFVIGGRQYYDIVSGWLRGTTTITNNTSSFAVTTNTSVVLSADAAYRITVNGITGAAMAASLPVTVHPKADANYSLSVSSNIPVVDFKQTHAKGLTYNYTVSASGSIPTWNATLGKYAVTCNWWIQTSGLTVSNFSSATSGSLTVAVDSPAVIPISLNASAGSGSYTMQISNGSTTYSAGQAIVNA